MTMPTIVINKYDLPARHAALRDGYLIIYCGRGTPWGNAYRMQKEADRAKVIALHRADVLHSPVYVENIKKHLTGAALECFCKPKACHCDLYADICNGKIST